MTTKLIIFESKNTPKVLIFKNNKHISISNYSLKELKIAIKNKIYLNGWSPTKNGKIIINSYTPKNNFINFKWVKDKNAPI